jgi:hypothetical protein
MDRDKWGSNGTALGWGTIIYRVGTPNRKINSKFPPFGTHRKYGMGYTALRNASNHRNLTIGIITWGMEDPCFGVLFTGNTR